MSNTTSLRTSVIPTSNDIAVYTSGQPIYSAASGFGKKDSTVLVAPGQVVFYNPATKLSTGSAATFATAPLIKIGVGIDLNNDGQSDDIRWFNDGFSGCSMRDMAGRAPICGVPSITDGFFGCIKCNETYTIEVQVYDPTTLAFGQPGIGFIYHFSYFYPCGDCTSGDCNEQTPNGDEVMCGLYNKIKGIENDPNWDITLNNLPLPSDHEYRFDVAKLYDGAAGFADGTTFEYCLTGSDSTCKDCDLYDPIGGYSLTGESDVAFSPVTVTEVSEGVFKSTKAQVQSAVDQLNVALGGSGSAIFIPAVGNCCSNNKIEINTCLLDFELQTDGDGTVISTCDEGPTNPFSTFTTPSECQDCDSQDNTFTLTNGLRFYSKPIEGECDCIPGNRALVEYFSEVEVYFKRGWELSGTKVVKRQYATLPKGQGFQWQAREIANFRDGFTEPFVTNNWGGKYGFPDANDILRQVKVDCTDSYCVIGGTYQGKTRHDNTGETSFVPQTVYLLIPDDHSTAKASILTAWNNLFTGTQCGVASITCASY